MTHSHLLLTVLLLGVNTFANNPTDATNVLIDQAISHSHRSESDRKSDMHRHPKAVLSFAQIKEGNVVLDVFAGGGYYSELSAHIVGEKGRVDAFNNQAYVGFVGDQLTQRLANNGLPNVRRIDQEVDQLQLEPNTYDVIIASMAFHDVYYADLANGWPEIHAQNFYKALHQALKSDGVLIVIDHSAIKGSGISSTQSLHRIDETYLINDLKKAGFVPERSSDVLRNPKDSRDLSSFEPRIRFQTDRFLWRLKKR